MSTTHRKPRAQTAPQPGALVLRIHALPPKGGRLALDMDEYRLARNALNQLCTRRIAEGGYTDAVDDALCRFL